MLLSAESTVWIDGKYKREVRQLFGDVDVHWDYRSSRHICFTASKILPNFYGNAHAGDEPVEKNPLYILVPDQTVRNVWPGLSKPDQIRYGTAERHKDGEIITPAIGIFKGAALLYICLQALREKDVELLEIGSLGM